MNDLLSLFEMGNHGVYVWSSYGVGLAIIMLNIVIPLKKKAHIVIKIKRIMRRKEH